MSTPLSLSRSSPAASSWPPEAMTGSILDLGHSDWIIGAWHCAQTKDTIGCFELQPGWAAYGLGSWISAARRGRIICVVGASRSIWDAATGRVLRTDGADILKT